MGSLRRAAIAHASLVLLIELSASPVFAQACSLTGTWSNEYGASVSIVVNNGQVSGNAVYPNVGGDIGFGGAASDSGMRVPFSPCPGNASDMLRNGGTISLTLSDCNTASGGMINPAGGNISALNLRRISDSPSGGSSCPGGNLPPPPPAPPPGSSNPPPPPPGGTTINFPTV